MRSAPVTVFSRWAITMVVRTLDVSTPHSCTPLLWTCTGSLGPSWCTANPAIANCQGTARRAGGVHGGGAAEQREGTMDAAEHRAIIATRWPDRSGLDSEFRGRSRGRS